MPADRRNRRSLLALLLLAALILLTLDFREGGEGPLSTAQTAVASAFAPVQDAAAAAVRPIGNLFASIGELGSLREQNATLEAELRSLREQQVLLARLAGENDRLRELVGMKERLDLSTTAGMVVAQPPGAFRWTVLIDIGEEHGVRENMAVINADGLVGKVVEVSPAHARVQLAAGPTAGFAVRVEETGQHGLLSGRGTNPMQLQVIDDPEREVPAGARVVTRWFQGTAIPDGIPVGVVAEEAPGQSESSQFVAVRPNVDSRRLDLVMVILDAPAAPEDLPTADTGDAGPDEG
jgi:rod shape-determining protein MreC